jgi:membrane protein required for beta-lactamase induction
LPGALLYRLINVSAETASGPVISVAALKMEAIMDWVPVRILTFLFALGGNFNQVLEVWRKGVILGTEANKQLLTDCGMAAITENPDKIPEDGSLERRAVSMLDIVFIIVLVVVCVVVILF